MAQATFRHGKPLMVDYTPGSDVSAGDIVLVGVIPFVAHSDINANVLGAVAARHGVYRLTAEGNLSPATKVYWDHTAKKITVTTNSGANKHFGFILPSSDPAADGDPVDVVHDPDGSGI
jgi:predicted RecA/RadA family phage recombinase